MKIHGGLIAAVLGAWLVGCSSGGSQASSGADASSSGGTCGDGICEASEVDTCPADCGTSGNAGSGTSVCNNDGICESANGETSANCPNDCGSTGSNTGSATSGPLDCTDATVEIDCWLCTAGLGCSGVDATSCAACTASAGSGTGTGSGGDMGSGALDCSDDATQNACLACVFESTCTGAGITAAACDTCLGL